VTPVRIIGVGSPYGLDALGWRAVEALRCGSFAQRFPTGLVSLENCKLPVHLYSLVDGCRLAVIIDAVMSDGRQPLKLEPAMLRNPVQCHSVHAVGVGEMLDLLEALTLRPPRVLLFGLPMPEGEGPADAERCVHQMLPGLCHRVEVAVREWLGAVDSVAVSQTQRHGDRLR
jgi:hydrogenase maturation protease